MRIGIFGGAFDPVHLGHLLLAEACREAARLDQVRFLPSYRPPHKPHDRLSRFDARVDMLELAVVAQPKFIVDPIERELPPPSFTVQTLEALRDRHPGVTLHLLVGADSLADLPRWRDPARILELAELVAVPRPGVTPPTAAELGAALGLSEVAVRLQTVAAPEIGLRSRDLRGKLAAGRSVRFAVPRAVEEYARERNLYGT